MALRFGILGTGWGTRIALPAFRAEGWEVGGPLEFARECSAGQTALPALGDKS